MHINRLLFISFSCLAALGQPAIVFAEETQHHHAHDAAKASAVTGDPAIDIPTKLKAIFETAETPLTVEPVVVSGNWAVAGWTQQGRGGRALLTLKDSGWSIYLCSGDSLKEMAALHQIGVPHADAEQIAKDLAAAEATLPKETLALFASFEGTVMVEGGNEHDHSKHHGAEHATP
jgi:hypothetical protein